MGRASWAGRRPDISPASGDRWICLAGGCALIVCAGAVYGFGAIAEDLKKELHLGSKETGLVGLAGNVGLWFGSFSGGMVADRHGPRIAMLGGALMFLLGYGGMFMAVSAKMPGLRAPSVVAAIWLVVGIGSGWIYNATIFTNLPNFSPKRRGPIVGVLATLFGAASTIWATILNGCIGGHPALYNTSSTTTAAPQIAYGAAAAVAMDGGVRFARGGDAGVLAARLPFDHSATSTSAVSVCEGGWPGGDLAQYFLLLAVLLPLLTAAGASVSTRLDPRALDRISRREADAAVGMRTVWVCMTVVLLLAAVGTFTALTATLDGDPSGVTLREWAAPIVTALLGIVVAAPLIVRPRLSATPPPANIYDDPGFEPVNAVGIQAGGRRPLLPKPGSPSMIRIKRSLSESSHALIGPPTEESIAAAAAARTYTLRTAPTKLKFWLLWAVTAIVCGANLSTLNIISIIITDRRIGSIVIARLAAVLTMLVSACGRFIGGYAISAAPRKPVPMWLVTVSALLAAGGQACLTQPDSTLLFVACVLIGASDGIFWTSLPIAMGRLFGTKHSGSIFGCMVCLASVGVILLSYVVQPAVYDEHTAAGSHTCKQGLHCFRLFHVICAGMCVIALGTSLTILSLLSLRGV